MAETAYDFFTTATSAAWSNPANVLAVPGLSSEGMGNAPPEAETQPINLGIPKSGPEVPAGAQIVGIDVEINANCVQLGFDSRFFGNFTIAGGLTKTTATEWTSAPPSTKLLSGDLAFWGLTPAEAKTFAQGGDATLTALNVNRDQMTCQYYWIQVRFSYSTLIAPPTLF
jgi:hypothetical protein